MCEWLQSVSVSGRVVCEMLHGSAIRSICLQAGSMVVAFAVIRPIVESDGGHPVHTDLQHPHIRTYIHPYIVHTYRSLPLPIQYLAAVRCCSGQMFGERSLLHPVLSLPFALSLLLFCPLSPSLRSPASLYPSLPFPATSHFSLFLCLATPPAPPQPFFH